MGPYQAIIDQITATTHKDGKSLVQRALKLCEETGELAGAVLSETSAPGCGYKNKTSEDVLEEGCDVVIVAFSLLKHYGFSDYDIQKKIAHKLTKWEAVIKDEL